MKKHFTLLSFILCNTCLGSDSSLGTWNILNLKYSLNSNISFFAEAQVRSLMFYDRFHYYEYKGGVNYRPNSGMIFSFGVGESNT
ncbi:MAG: DUF2490 domain-containing protein [Lentimicrobium sp.]